MDAQPLEILKKYWGYPRFRPLQEEIVQSVLGGRDTLALLPTGGGKSVCFQVPALCRPGICLVISPLIALMKDQVYQLRQRGIAAEAVYSGMPYREIDRILDNCVYGNIRLLYLSPERLTTTLALERIKQMPVNLLAVDEAHCISQWGYDFRPSYLEIAQIRKWMPKVPVLALTATATPEVVQDIQEKLGFPGKNVLQKSFSRPNLAYIVRQTENKEQQLVNILKKVEGSGIVYVRNRRKTQETAFFLQQNKIPADFYHAGLPHEARSEKQDAWIQNRTRIIVATNAFGMGIDKPDVRVVVHLDLPDSLEAYFQEAGRGGRDGRKAYSVLLYHESDRMMLERQFEQAFPELPEIRKTYLALGSYFQLATGGGKGQSFDFDIAGFSAKYGLNAVTAFNCLKILEQDEWLEISEAVYRPPSIQILVNKDQLYDYQLKNPQLEKILKIILRSYQGAFSGQVLLQEKKLAGFLKIPPEQLQQGLATLHSDQILEYIPQKDKPQLIFLRDRVAAENLEINMSRYMFRKQRQQLQVQKAIEYATGTQCRSGFLLGYFGEVRAQSCGICDICIAENKTSHPRNNDYYIWHIRSMLHQRPLDAAGIIAGFPFSEREPAVSVLHFLIEEGFVVEKDRRFFWNSPKQK